MRTRKQTLSLLVLVAAALASAASDGGGPEPYGNWQLTRSVGGSPLTLGSSLTRGISAEINAAAFSEGDAMAGGAFEVSAYACVLDSSQGVGLRAMLLPRDGRAGPVRERVLPGCPQTEVLLLQFYDIWQQCTSGGPCATGIDARFERIGAAGTDLQISWDVLGIASFDGEDDTPPAAADLLLEVDP